MYFHPSISVWLVCFKFPSDLGIVLCCRSYTGTYWQ